MDRLAEVLDRWDAAAPCLPAAAAILPPPGPPELPIGPALLRPRQIVPLAQAVGRTAAEYVWAYPPGVPLLAPGERVTPAFAEAAANLQAMGTALHHSAGGGAGALAVLA